MIIEVLKSSPLTFIQILYQKKFDSIKKASIHLRPLLPISPASQGPLYMSSVTGMNFALGSYEKFQPEMRIEKRPKILGTMDKIWRQIRETKLNMAKHKHFAI